MRLLLLLPFIALLVGFGVLNAQVGAIMVLAALLVSGVLYRLCKLLCGALLILIGLS